MVPPCPTFFPRTTPLTPPARLRCGAIRRADHGRSEQRPWWRFGVRRAIIQDHGRLYRKFGRRLAVGRCQRSFRQRWHGCLRQPLYIDLRQHQRFDHLQLGAAQLYSSRVDHAWSTQPCAVLDRYRHLEGGGYLLGYRRHHRQDHRHLAECRALFRHWHQQLSGGDYQSWRR